MPRPSRMARRQFFSQAVGGSVALGGLQGAAAQPPAPAAPALPAGSLQQLAAAVESVLTAKRLGEPVFVRCSLFTSSPEKQTLPWLSRLAELAARWVAQPLEAVFAVGASGNGQVSLTIRFRGGASAIVSIADSQGPVKGVDLVLLGNRGAAYHEAGWADVGLDSAQPNPKMLALLRRALGSGQPESVGGDEQP